jgi:hypothetical protein
LPAKFFHLTEKGELKMVETGWLYALINVAASGTLVSGTSGAKIRVLACVLDANNGNATAYFTSSTGPTRLCGNLFLSSGAADYSTATGQLVMPYSPVGWFETAAGDDLDIVLEDGSAGVGGLLVYELVQ